MAHCAREGCSNPPASPKARFCDSEECRRARSRQRKRKERGQIIEFPVAEPGDSGSVFEAAFAELEAAGREGTPLGRAALTLARRMDAAGADTGSSLAALSRELRVTLEEAMRGVTPAADALDDLRGRVVRLAR